MEKGKSLVAEHPSIFDTVSNLGGLYVLQGKITEAEQMLNRALQGYEKALGTDDIMTSISALDTICCLGAVAEYQADLKKPRILYSKALVGSEKVYGPDHSECRSLRDMIRSLDYSVEEAETLKEVREPVENPQVRASSHLDAAIAPSQSKRKKLFTKLGFR